MFDSTAIGVVAAGFLVVVFVIVTDTGDCLLARQRHWQRVTCTSIPR